MGIRLISSLLVIFTLISCSDDEPNINSNKAEEFLNEVLDVMETNSINRYNINWTDFRIKAFEKVVDAKTIQDTYPGIREALVLLDDNHSSFIKPGGSTIYVSNLQCGHQNIVKPSLPENIGYVKVNSFSGSSSSVSAISFAQEIQGQIRNNDHIDIKGWIVDLRNNGGGNMWPMIAGIGPILGEGTAGYFIDPDNNQASWGFKNGSSVANGNTVTQLANSYELIAPSPKVAILLNSGIASSGEALAVSFIGRKNTKSFGFATCGQSTGNNPFTLSDNSILNLTTVFLADRNKNRYGIPINPDLVVDNEDIILQAVEWIEN